MGGEPWPFLGQEAVRQGRLSARQLQKDYRAIYRNVYMPSDGVLTAVTRARGAWLWSGGRSTLVGLSAAAVLGSSWIDSRLPAELSRADRHSPSGILAHTYDLATDECCVIDGMRVTTPARTAFDIGRTLPRNRAVGYLDALIRATGLDIPGALALADRNTGVRGVRRLRCALEYADGGAESPQETRVRLLLIDAGLPRPETQIEFTDEFGVVCIRMDMGWREWRVAVEYDGVQHWLDRYQRSWDIDRIAMLEAAGWTVIRVSSEMLSRPAVIVDRVTRALRSAGCAI